MSARPIASRTAGRAPRRRGVAHHILLHAGRILVPRERNDRRAAFVAGPCDERRRPADRALDSAKRVNQQNEANMVAQVRRTRGERLRQVDHEVRHAPLDGARARREMVKKMPKLDWTERESVRATLRRNVRRMLAKYGYPPDLSEDATQLVLRQAELGTENESD